MKHPTSTLKSRVLALAGLLALLAAGLTAATTLACGGFFCLNSPINQQVERIIFTQRGRDITAYVQINYTGEDESFAWVVPVPSVPEVDVVEMGMFTELDTMTAPVFIPPPMPECARQRMVAMSAVVPASSGVTVYSTGEVGPFGFDVIGSDDPQALIDWLKENGYRIEPAMEPLVHVYVQEKMLFLAMKLRPDKGVQDIQPVKMTYQSDWPMIPLRLTAVAANPNMGVLVWLFGDTQYEPANYEKLEIPDSQIQFDPFGGHSYFLLRSQAIDGVGGQGFVTEFAGASRDLVTLDDDLKVLLNDYSYLTRMYTEISPEEMTVDPTFRYNASLPPVSNIHDLSNRPPALVFGCEGQAAGVSASTNPSVTGQAASGDGLGSPAVWLFGALLVAGLVITAFAVGRRLRR